MHEEPAVARAAAIAALGLRPTASSDVVDRAAATALTDVDPRVRAAAIAALARAGSTGATQHAWTTAVHDDSPDVRRRACEVAPLLATRAPSRDLVDELVAALDDPEPTVIESAAWALGELPDAVTAAATAALARTATTHDDPLAREAAVAALGARADPSGLDAILAACTDKPAVRRRAVLALAPFDDPRVDHALRQALDDRDWQVRQAAEDLLAPPDGEP